MSFASNEFVKKILDHYRKVWAVGHALSLMSWDSETYMPEEGVYERSIATGELSVLAQKLILDGEFVRLVDKAYEALDELNDYERGVVRVLRREIRIARALPPELVMELSKTSSEAKVVWRRAREKDDFGVFQPYLEKIVELTRKKAEYLGYEKHPYDALIDLYEEGVTTEDIDSMFSYIEPRLKHIIDRVLGEGRYPQRHPLEKVRYDKEAMRQLNTEVLMTLGYPFNRARIDVSAHPFTINMGVRDVRITTRYEGYDFKRSFLATIHEFGHALYELQVGEELAATPLARGVSMGIHESQSRFWENIVGRSRPFVSGAYPMMSKWLDFLSKYSPEDVYLYFNTVRPSLIRTEADELTYNLHILLRFKLEKQMVTGEVRVSDLPELWSSGMEELLGVRPRGYADGVLQDIHWSMGAIGYFPTYSLGNIVSAQILHYASRDIPDFYGKVESMSFSDVREYLAEKVHRWGATYPPKELLRRSFGEGVNPRYFIEYLESKYLG